MADEKRMVFYFDVTYFKDNGKFYTSERVGIETALIGPHESPYMNDATDYLESKREEHELPGLQSGKWDGFILVNHEEGYPCLILPKEKRNARTD